MIILGVDPAPNSCGMAIYSTTEGRVLQSRKDMPIEDLTDKLLDFPRLFDVVVIERVQSYGISGSSLLQTSETGGRIWQTALIAGIDVFLYYRREVLRLLDVSGKGNRDSLVRQRVLEIHGGDRSVAVGKKATPGPCYGVSGDSWQALAVALAHTHSKEYVRA